LKQAKDILSGNYPKWFTKLDNDTQNKLLAFYSIADVANKYISKPELSEQVNYKRVPVEDVIAFPFTYKIAVKNEHGHVPMY